MRHCCGRGVYIFHFKHHRTTTLTHQPKNISTQIPCRESRRFTRRPRNFNTSSASGSTSHHFHIHTSSQLGPYNINDPMSISEDSSPGVSRAVEYLKAFRSRVSCRRSLGGLWEVVMSRVREMFTSRILNGGRITVIGGIVLSRDVDKIIQLGESGGDTLREVRGLFLRGGGRGEGRMEGWGRIEDEGVGEGEYQKGNLPTLPHTR